MLSMTGFGAGSNESEFGAIRVEIKGVNNRYFSPTIKLPRTLLALEERIRSLLKAQVQRGRIDVIVSIDGFTDLPCSHSIALSVVRDLVEQLRAVGRDLGIQGELSYGDLVRLPDIFVEHERPFGAETIWAAVEPALHTALTQFTESREREGAAIAEALDGSLAQLASGIAKISAIAASLLPLYKEKLIAGAKALAPELSLNPQRLEQEAVLLADKADITEEINRVGAHLIAFKNALTAPESAGRRLDFLGQELLREFTTIGAKCGNSEGASLVISCKSELDKIREQLQNVE